MPVNAPVAAVCAIKAGASTTNSERRTNQVCLGFVPNHFAPPPFVGFLPAALSRDNVCLIFVNPLSLQTTATAYKRWSNLPPF